MAVFTLETDNRLDEFSDCYIFRLGISIFILETDNPSKTGYPCSPDNPSLCEYGTVFILDG